MIANVASFLIDKFLAGKIFYLIFSDASILINLLTYMKYCDAEKNVKFSVPMIPNSAEIFYFF